MIPCYSARLRRQRPPVCQKSIIPGSGMNGQGAIWKCFQGQVQCDTLHSAFISSFPALLPPLVSLQHPCSLLASATFATHLRLLSSVPDLSSLHLCEPHPAFSSDHDSMLPEHSPHGSDKFRFEDKNTGHMSGTGQTLHIWGFTDLWSSPRPHFMKPQVFSKCVSMTVAGYSKVLSVEGQTVPNGLP